MNSCYWVFKFIFYVVFKLFNRLKVFSRERIPKEGGVIAVSNHASYIDPLVVGTAIDRRATFMARRGLFKVPVLRTFVSSFSFPVSRTKPQASTIKEAVKRLKRGELIVMFPQGSRSTDGDIAEIKRGVSVIARLSRAKVVPLILEGTEKAFPIGSLILMPARIRVKIGHPIEVGNGTDDEITGKIMEAMKELRAMKVNKP